MNQPNGQPNGHPFGNLPKCKCGKEGHRQECPYAGEIHGEIKMCNCCDDCHYECRMDI